VSFSAPRRGRVLVPGGPISLFAFVLLQTLYTCALWRNVARFKLGFEGRVVEAICELDDIVFELLPLLRRYVVHHPGFGFV
jgi:hypothetical protein